MKVFIDGEQVECNNDVKIIYENRIIDDPNIGELHITLNHEGMIADSFENDNMHRSYKSMWKDLDDIIEETH